LPSSIQEKLQRFADLGLEISSTEMDVGMILPATPDLLVQQASVHAQVLEDSIAVRSCGEFTVCEYTDKCCFVQGSSRDRALGAALGCVRDVGRRDFLDALLPFFLDLEFDLAVPVRSKFVKPLKTRRNLIRFHTMLNFAAPK
jgi:hypothetical protein